MASLDVAALDERGWPPMRDDPRAAARRAARSLAYVAHDHRLVVLHTLAYGLSGRGASSIGRLLDEELVRALGSVEGAHVTVLARREGALEDTHRASADLAVELEADSLVVLTKAPVVRARISGHQRAIRVASPRHLASVTFESPADARAVAAAASFVEASGRRAAIGAIDHADALVRQEGGTVVRPSVPRIMCYGASDSQSAELSVSAP